MPGVDPDPRLASCKEKAGMPFRNNPIGPHHPRPRRGFRDGRGHPASPSHQYAPLATRM